VATPGVHRVELWRTLPFPVGVEHKHAVGRPGDVRGRKLRRLLLGGDVIALCSALLRTQLVFGAVELRGPPLLLSIPLWVLLAYGHRLYHVDSYRAGCGGDRPGAPDGHSLEVGHVARALRGASRALTCAQDGALLADHTRPSIGPPVGYARLRKVPSPVLVERIDYWTRGSGEGDSQEDPAPR
jgi:hypothetical protein